MYHTATKLKLCFPKGKIAEQDIFIPQTLDSLNLPIKHGLQDSDMGPQAHELNCSFCELNNFNCPGHFGSINLNTMLLNPLLFTNLYAIIVASCQNCHRFKISEHDRDFCEESRSQDLFNKLKELSTDKCPFCKHRTVIKKLNQKILANEKYLQPSRIFENVSFLYANERKMFDLLSCDYRSFFLHRVYLMPNKFRPLNVFEGKIFESAHNIHLTRIIKVNNLLKQKIQNFIVQLKNEEFDSSGKSKGFSLEKKQKIEEKDFFEVLNSHFDDCNGVNLDTDRNLNILLENLPSGDLSKLNGIIAALQSTVHHYFDSTDFPSATKPPGIKQILEKKEGLFRQNMMGKRVNFTARTVISADPYIATDEIGVPVRIAKKLTFPERVTASNRKRLEEAVINGSNYPGAEFVVEKGIKRNLKFVKNRKYIARTLLKNNAIVHRHMSEDDFVLVNRQPTLHKSSLMSHRVKILRDKTIRLHYVNCNSYNADFDGDEMNIHLCQNYQAMAEHSLSATHENFILNGKPLRGLVQDYIVAMFQITLKDSLFTRQETIHLLISSKKEGFKVKKPAILRPKEMFTGKQVLQFLLNEFGEIDYTNKNKISPAYWKLNTRDLGDITRNLVDKNTVFKDEETNSSDFTAKESQVLIRSGVFLHGVLDKSQIGPTTNSLFHHHGQTYDYKITNDLLSSLCLMVTQYLLGWGVGLGLSDLILTESANLERSKILKDGVKNGDDLTSDILHVSMPQPWSSSIKSKISQNGTVETQDVKLDPVERDNLNNTVKKKINETGSAISNLLIKSLLVPFPRNNMANIILSGAKGSIVNFSQISGLLGQQSLEGGRVPILPNGRGLCSFTDYGVVSNGFVINRFLTGLTPSSFFFHCQGGREGLVDTAVKTSIAGYLQRCCVTMLENARVEYDGSVRDNGIIQFVYGEDGKNPNYSTDQKPHRKNIHPGESVGVLAAQAVGEPSTQMTLNTFHLAGCATNVTLGMPRLKEILMIGGKSKRSILRADIQPNLIKNGDKSTFKQITGLFDKFVRLTLREVLYYHRVTQTDSMEVLLVFKQNISNGVKEEFKRTFFKELNKASGHKKAVYEIKRSMSEQEEQEKIDEFSKRLADPKNMEELNEALENIVQDGRFDEEYDEKVHSEIDLLDQIRNSDFDKENVLKMSLNIAICVDFVIEKMLDTFLIVDSGIENVEYDESVVNFGGIDYFKMFDAIIPRKSLPFDTFTSLSHENEFGIPKRASFSEIVDFNTSYSTDIGTTLEILGVEAARFTIINEIKTVFSAYGISIDIRHLMLIADKMTFSGGYIAFNRHKMEASLLSKIAFENTYGFLKNGFMFQQEDLLEEPSSRLVVGKPIKNGTGSFDVLDAETGEIF